MGRVRNFRDLDVWQRAVDLSVAIYHVTGEFPKSELYGITSQMRRSAVSIASNIAEDLAEATKISPDFSRLHKDHKPNFTPNLKLLKGLI